MAEWDDGVVHGWLGWTPVDNTAFSMPNRGVWARITFLKTIRLAVRLCILTTLCACAGNGGRSSFAGSSTVIAGGCPELAPQGSAVHSVLTLRDNTVVFMPADGIVELTGQVDAAGHVTASSSAVGADHHEFKMVFDGKLADHAVVGTFATPRCRASVRMNAV